MIIKCESTNDFTIAKTITRDYIKWLDMNLSFQDIDKEFKLFEKIYSQPAGCFIYAQHNNVVAGGVGCRKFEKDICEMKRLFVYEKMRDKGIGKRLCLEIISIAKILGYKKMRLDTIAKLNKAIKLYENIGFYDIPKYRENPDPTARYMEIQLENWKY